MEFAVFIFSIVAVVGGEEAKAVCKHLFEGSKFRSFEGTNNLISELRNQRILTSV